MRGLSESITTLIIAGTIIMVSLTIFYYSLANLQQAALSSEYGYVRSIFLGIADSIPDIIQGGTYGARLPSRMVGVGYIYEVNDFINIIIFNNTEVLINYTDNPMALHASTYASLVVSERTVYGVDQAIVNETSLIPYIREYYLNGVTHLTLDTTRFYVKIYEYDTANKHVYVINVLYVKLTVKIQSSKPVQIAVSLGPDIVNEHYVSITDLRLIRIRNGIVKEIGLFDLIPNPQPGSDYVVNLVVKNIIVVLT